jgi:hypothetical protein
MEFGANEVCCHTEIRGKVDRCLNNIEIGDKFGRCVTA